MCPTGYRLFEDIIFVLPAFAYLRTKCSQANHSDADTSIHLQPQARGP
jgi:hypothetical protein